MRDPCFSDHAETPQGADDWLAGYEILKKVSDKLQMRTLREFDKRFAGTELLQNWVQDLEMALGDLARPRVCRRLGSGKTAGTQDRPK